MKTTAFFLLCSLLLITTISCSEDEKDEKFENRIYQINNHEVLLVPNQESLGLKFGDYMYAYINEETGKKEYTINLSGYFMHGLWGLVHNVPQLIGDLEIPDTGIKISVSGEARYSPGHYSIPEMLPIDFYCSSIAISDK